MPAMRQRLWCIATLVLLSSLIQGTWATGNPHLSTGSSAHRISRGLSPSTADSNHQTSVVERGTHSDLDQTSVYHVPQRSMRSKSWNVMDHRRQPRLASSDIANHMQDVSDHVRYSHDHSTLIGRSKSNNAGRKRSNKVAGNHLSNNDQKRSIDEPAGYHEVLSWVTDESGKTESRLFKSNSKGEISANSVVQLSQYSNNYHDDDSIDSQDGPLMF
jgi:hypothetical protein